MRRQSFFILFVIALAIIGATLKSYWIEAIVDQGQPVQSSALWNGLTWLGELVPKAHAYDAYAKTARDFRILDALRVCIGLDLASIALCLLVLPYVLCFRLTKGHLRRIASSNKKFLKNIWKYTIYSSIFAPAAIGFPLYILTCGGEISFTVHAGGRRELANYPILIDPHSVSRDTYIFMLFTIALWIFISSCIGASIRIRMSKREKMSIYAVEEVN
ncbi:hypothetical protein [Rhodoligotrophos defluvii]|uniref:hypothetical protein n=1 Tax=Rhodoligotrophos defluvii TaxID=2561934 RepID=UPI0010C9EE72|nr:hypothetical protein [Rhodoligotrophos defluvii]